MINPGKCITSFYNSEIHKTGEDWSIFQTWIPLSIQRTLDTEQEQSSGSL